MRGCEPVVESRGGVCNVVRGVQKIPAIALGGDDPEAAEHAEEDADVHDHDQQQGEEEAVLQHVRLLARDDPHSPVEMEAPPEAALL